MFTYNTTALDAFSDTASLSWTEPDFLWEEKIKKLLTANVPKMPGTHIKSMLVGIPFYYFCLPVLLIWLLYATTKVSII